MRLYELIIKLKLTEIILFLLPISLVTGPLIPDLFMISFSFYGLYLIFKKEIFLKFFKYIIFFGILCIYLISRSLLSDNILLSLESSLFYLRFPLFAIGFGFFLYLNYQKISYFCFGTILIIFLLLIDSLLQFITGYNLLGFQIVNLGRISSFFKDELILGSYVSRVFPILIYSLLYLFKNKKKILQFSYIFSISLCFVLVYISGERTAMAIFVIANLLLIVNLKTYRKVFLYSLLFISIFVVVLNSHNDHIKNRLIAHTIYQLTENSKTINIFSKVHQEHFYSAYLMFNDNKFFGKGPKTFRHECKKEKFNPTGCSSHPHNIFFQVISETGLVGLLFLIYIYYKIILSLIKLKLDNKNLDTYKYIFLTAIIINILPIIPSGNLFNNWLNFIFYLPLALMIFVNLFEDKRFNKI